MGTLLLRTPTLPPLFIFGAFWWREACNCERQNDINALFTIEKAHVLYVVFLFFVTPQLRGKKACYLRNISYPYLVIFVYHFACI